MGRNFTNPTLYNDAIKLKMGTLKELGCILNETLSKNTLEWKINGEKIAQINIYIKIDKKDSFIVLDYFYRGKKMYSKIQIISKVSNLGIGIVWYFVCPLTQKNCRTLYAIKGEFGHREAFKSCMYENQTYSKKNRVLFKRFSLPYIREDAYEKIYSKHFKKTYNGVYTIRYLRLISQIKKDEFFND